MEVVVFSIQLDEEDAGGGDDGDLGLEDEVLDEGAGVGGGEVVGGGEEVEGGGEVGRGGRGCRRRLTRRHTPPFGHPSREGTSGAGGFGGKSEEFCEGGAEVYDFGGEAGGEGHFVGIPARDGGEGAVGGDDVRGEEVGFDEADGAAVEDEDIADADVLHEGFLDLTEVAAAEADLDHRLGVDGADVLVEVAGDARVREREVSGGVEADLAEDVFVVAFQGHAAAAEIAENAIELGALEVVEGIAASDEGEGFVGGDGFEDGETDEGLGEDVEGVFVNLDGLELASGHHACGDGAFGEIVDVARDEETLGDAAHRVAGAADALKGAGDAFRGGDHDDEIDRADVDAHLERGGADDGAELAALEAVFDVETNAAVEGGVMNLDEVGVFGEKLFETEADRFGAAAGVGENERGFVAEEERAELLENAGGGVTGGWIRALAEGGEDLDAGGVGLGDLGDVAGAAGTDEEGCDGFEGGDGGGEADPRDFRFWILDFRMFELRRLGDWNNRKSRIEIRNFFEAFGGDGEHGAALVFGEGVKFVGDEEAGGAEGGDPVGLAEEERDRLGRGDENVGRFAALLGAFFRRGVAGARADAKPGPAELFGGLLEIFAEIVGERAEG